MLSLVDACLGRLPSPAAGPCRPLLRLLSPRTCRAQPWRHQQLLVHQGSDATPSLRCLSAHAATAGAAEDFYAANEVSFGGLGLSAEVCTALQQAGYLRPAHAQELAVPAILAGRDVVLAAETGSGKTLAYLAPLVSLALRNRQQAPAVAAAAAESQTMLPVGTAAAENNNSSSSGMLGYGWSQQEASQAPRRHRNGPPAAAALVLCPNAALCQQVVAAAAALRDPATGAPLAAAAFVSGQAPPPQVVPDIVVSTPGALLSLIDNTGPAYGHEWTRAGFPSWARRVVFDEADLLLSGGYGAQMRIIWDASRAGDRAAAARRICAQVGLSEEEWLDLPRHLRRAAQRGGAQGLLDAGFKPRDALHDSQKQQQEQRQHEQQRKQQQGIMQSEEDEDEEEEWDLEGLAATVAPAATRGASSGSSSGNNEQQGNGNGSSGNGGGSSSSAWRRQYVFVAATMPAEGERSVGAELAARFPEAAWLSGRQLHQSKRAVEHSWRQVGDEAAREQALQEVVAADEQLQAGTGRMLVFARDVATADATAAALAGGSSNNAGGSSAVNDYDSLISSLGSSAGDSTSTSSNTANSSSNAVNTRGRTMKNGRRVEVLRYHKGVPAEQRGEALERMRGEAGLVMVCTDAAARGLDVPDITHVVQADFAPSAIDFLHRVGRTGRAGKGGRVTSLYAPEAAPLVQAIQDSIAAGEPVEGAFSRKRSFRKKMKKYGEYVPRGQVGPAAPRQARKAELAERSAERRQRWQ